MEKCKRCRLRIAVWAWQVVGGNTTLSLLGNHYRGFRVVKVCDPCHDEIKQSGELHPDQLPLNRQELRRFADQVRAAADRLERALVAVEPTAPRPFSTKPSRPSPITTLG